MRVIAPYSYCLGPEYDPQTPQGLQPARKIDLLTSQPANPGHTSGRPRVVERGLSGYLGLEISSAGFSCRAAVGPPNLAYGNENDLRLRLLLPRIRQQPRMGARQCERRQRRQAAHARRQPGPMRDLLEPAAGVDEEGP